MLESINIDDMGTEQTSNEAAARSVEALDSVVIRFVGDSGDGMQLTGAGFSMKVAKAGHDFATHPDDQSEIASRQGFTSGDAPDVLVAMNPVALKTNMSDVKRGGTIIANTGAFGDASLKKAGYQNNPLEDGSFDGHRLIKIDISALTVNALADSGLSKKDIGRCKSCFALGLMLCLYRRPIEQEIEEIKDKFAGKPEFAEANIRALEAGFAYADAR